MAQATKAIGVLITWFCTLRMLSTALLHCIHSIITFSCLTIHEGMTKKEKMG
jgi:hypothetical protein